MRKEGTGRRKAQALETRNRIYDSANRLFTEQGFESVTVDAIVEMAGVSKGTFYVYFDSKNALVASMIGDYVKHTDLDYESYLKSFPAAAAEADILLGLAAKIADVITRTIGHSLMRTVYEIQLIRTINTDALWSYNRDLYRLVSEVIRAGIERGEFESNLPVDTIASHFVIGARGLTYEWCIRYPDFDLRERLVDHFRMLLTGITKRLAEDGPPDFAAAVRSTHS